MTHQECKVIAATDIYSFNQLLDEMLSNGWQLVGNLAVTPHHDSTGYGMQYSQMLTKPKPSEPIKPATPSKVPGDKVRMPL